MFTIKRISKVGSTELVINMYIRSLGNEVTDLFIHWEMMLLTYKHVHKVTDLFMHWEMRSLTYLYTGK